MADGGCVYVVLWHIYTAVRPFPACNTTRYRSVVLSLYTTINYVLYMLVCGIVGLGASLGSWRYSIFILGGLMIGLGLYAKIFVRNTCRV